MITLDDKIDSALYMLKHYESQANKCLSIYPKLSDGMDMWLFYQNMAQVYRDFLEKFL